MKKQTKNILTKLALVAAPFAVAATITTSSVSANAATVGDWVMNDHDKEMMAQATELENEGRAQNHITDAENAKAAAERQKKTDAQYQKDIIANRKDFKPNNNVPASVRKQIAEESESATGAKPAKKQAAKKATTRATKKHVAKKVVKKHTVKKHIVKKATKKHVAKKRVVRKHARKHARRLFRIRVKSNKIYAYKNVKFHKAGRKAEKKGTKLYVYGIVKKGHKTYYKVYGGRVITSYHKYVTKIAK